MSNQERNTSFITEAQESKRIDYVLVIAENSS